MSTLNPFLLEYQSGGNFCERKTEADKIKQLVSKGRVGMVTGLKRMGKTVLLQKTATGITALNKNINIIYIDIYPAVNVRSFICLMARQSLSGPEVDHLKRMREISNYFTHLRPIINYHPLSGKPELDFALLDGYNVEHTLEQLFSFLERQYREVLIILDELQQLMEFPEKSFIKLLQKFIFKKGKINFILAGSKCPSLTALLTDSETTFSDKTEIIRLGSLDHEAHKLYLINIFKINKRIISDTIADALLDWTRNHTYYTQYVCHRLFDKGIQKPDEWFIERLFAEILNENANVYYSYRKILTTNQWQLLTAIAKDKGAKQILSGEFIRKNNLGSTSSVQTALAALIEKELIYDEDGLFYVYDVFFSRWLESN